MQILDTPDYGIQKSAAERKSAADRGDYRLFFAKQLTAEQDDIHYHKES